MIPVALTIAGSDPSGGAGIQADLKTFSALRVYGMAVVTAVTVQNTRGVSGVHDVPVSTIRDQIDAVVEDIRPASLKTGMLSQAATIEAVADRIAEHGLSSLVVDPVMVSKSGAALLDPVALDTLRARLLPLALVLTPNLDEAEKLVGGAVRSPDQMERAARHLHGMGARHVLVKGGHLAGGAVVDVYFDGHGIERFTDERIAVEDTHGTGCVLSAAIAAGLAGGREVADAVHRARAFTREAISRGLRLGSGVGPVDPLGVGGDPL